MLVYLTSISRRFYGSLLKSKLNNKKILILGDGDFSFSVALSKITQSNPQLDYSSLIATTLAPREAGDVTHRNLKNNVANFLSLSNKNKVEYEIDATSIPSHLASDFIIWNFPHVDGKANVGKK